MLSKDPTLTTGDFTFYADDYSDKDAQNSKIYYLNLDNDNMKMYRPTEIYTSTTTKTTIASTSTTPTFTSTSCVYLSMPSRSIVCLKYGTCLRSSKLEHVAFRLSRVTSWVVI